MRVKGIVEKPQPLKVLLIEDDEDDFVLVRDLLSQIPTGNFDLQWASTYDAALEQLGQGGYDICLLDYRLGVHNGFEIMRETRPTAAGIPIIFLTGQGDHKVDLEAMHEGAEDYIVKDELSGPLLERSIRYAVERSRTMGALRRTRDELEQRVMERTAELAAANRAREAGSRKLSAYSLLHDLKNPAISLHGLAKCLHDGYGDILDEKGRNYCAQILGAAAHIASLLEKVNVFIATKESPLDIQSLHLKEILGFIREEFSDEFIAREIAWSEPDRLPVIRADRLSMIRVFRNLVENALKYGGDDLDEIKVWCMETEDEYILSVSDNGVGIKEKDMESILGPLERRGASNGIEGAGLGLAIVKEIAERHGGTVWAQAARERGVSILVSVSKSL